MKEARTHQPCPDCGSSDALQINKDGSTKCYSCQVYTPSIHKRSGVTNNKTMHNSLSDLLSITEYTTKELTDRGISYKTADLFNVKVECDTSTGEPTKHFYPYYKDGTLKGYKVRVIDGKIFYVKGDIKGCELYGQHLVNNNRKLIMVFEGECDAMAGKQMLNEQGKDYSCVSLPNGAGLKGLRDNMEFLDEFDTVMLDFDSDKPGQEALDKAVGLFQPGKVKVVKHKGYKDANEMLKDGKSKQFLHDVYNAKVHRPDGIVAMSDTWDTLFEDENSISIPYPWKGLNDKLYGIRDREIVTITGGTGIGKSAITREISHSLLKTTEDNIGVLSLEESVARTGWGIVAIEANLPLGIREERVGIDKKDIKEWYTKTLGTGRVYTFDHFGSTDEDNLISKVGYMVRVLDCKRVILDHLSIVVSAMDQGLDERKTIDSIMTKLRQLTEETGASLILVSHLKRVSGDRGHENGLEVSLNHLRGSQSIAQLSDAVISVERNQQADDDRDANTLTVRVLKNRYSGLTGLACQLYYNKDTGRLEEEEFGDVTSNTFSDETRQHSDETSDENAALDTLKDRFSLGD